MMEKFYTWMAMTAVLSIGVALVIGVISGAAAFFERTDIPEWAQVLLFLVGFCALLSAGIVWGGVDR